MRAPSRPGLALALLAVLCAGHALLRRAGAGLPLILDEGEYAVAAKAWASGGLPYRDAYTPKPPAVFLVYRAAYALSDDPAAPRLAALLASWFAMAFLFLAAPAAWSLPARLLAPAAYGALSPSPIGDMGFAANTEVFINAFLAAAAVALTRAWDAPPARGRAWLLVGGLAAGAALMMKQTCAPTLAAFAVLAAWSSRGRKPRSCLAFAAAAALPAAGFALYFWSRGAFAELWDQAFRRGVAYAGLVSGAALAGQLSWLGGTLLPLFLAGDWPFWALAGFGLAGARASWAHRVETLSAVWLACALVGACAGLFFFPHYFLLVLPPLALAAAAGFEEASRRLPVLRGAWGLAAALGLALYPVLARAGLYFFQPPEALARLLLFPNPLYEARSLGQTLRARARPGDALYVFGSEPQLYLYSGLPHATRHITVLPLTLMPRDSAEGRAEVALLKERLPRFIVYSTQRASTLIASAAGEEFRDAVRGLLAESYRYSGRVRALPRPDPFPPLEAASGPPPWDDDSSLLLFEAARRPSHKIDIVAPGVTPF